MGAFPYLPEIGRFIVRGGGGFAYGGGYAPVGNNPNTFSSGPVAERVADIAEGGNNTIYVGFQPLDPGDPENLPPAFAGFTGWAWGKDAGEIKSDLVNAGVTAATETFKIVTSIPTATFVAGILDDFGKAAFEYAKKKWKHLFAPKHNLEELIKIIGGEGELVKQVIIKVQEMNLPKQKVFEVVIDFSGIPLKVRGYMDDFPKIGTMFVSKH